MQQGREVPFEKVISSFEEVMPPPEYARIRRSVNCALCGERVMETRARVWEGEFCCIPCAEKRDAVQARSA